MYMYALQDAGVLDFFQRQKKERAKSIEGF